jgi:hypothetical protein
VASQKRRGLPEDAKASPKKKRQSKLKPKRRRRWLVSFRSIIRLIGILALVAVLGPALFIGVNCYSRVAPRSAAPVPEAAGIPGYGRAESFTYLTLPERFLVYSTDEYAGFIGRQRPSGFPYLRSARQYWSYYSSVCAVTKGAYPFDAGYHVMLGIIGSSFTIESTIRAVYENTAGRLTEWLSSTDTPEDEFARRTAREYGTFMHTVPWYEFPFASRLAGLWRETPLRGPHTLRKVERRFALTVEYGGKAIHGWLIGQAYGAEDLRIYARIEQVPGASFSDARVKQVKVIGPGSYIVTLPRYEAFTSTVLALTARGARIVDVAGNDEILITVLGRRGIATAVPHGRLIAVAPILTDPTMQRLAISVPVSMLREVAAHLASERATIEHVYDY